MIVDFHTHIFPPDVRERRDGYARRDPTFAEMYGDVTAKIATAEELLASMDAVGVNVSVALGFAWRAHEDCVRHNDYLLEFAAASGGRIVPFCAVNPALGDIAATEIGRCAAAGAKGLGELRPESQGWDLNGAPGDRLAAQAARHDLVLLFHVTEPEGHDYPGKQGLRAESFRRFAERHPDLKIVGAHLGGGLPLDGGEPAGAAYYDTAALRFLYESAALARATELAGGERVLFGSDFPLVGQADALADVRAAGLGGEALRGVLGGNAGRLLGLPAPEKG